MAQNGRTMPLRSRHDARASPSVAARDTLQRTERGVSMLVTSHHPSQDVFPTGRGTTASKVVTPCKCALTGQELGKWRRMRSLYCLTCGAILKRVRIMVEGCAWARAVCCRVCVRRPGGGPKPPTAGAA